MQKVTFNVYSGAGYEVVCGFEAKGKRFLAIRHTEGHVSESMLVHLTDEAIRRRNPEGDEQTVYRARRTFLTDSDLEYLCSLQEGQDHYMIANFGIIKALGMKITKLEGADVNRTLRGKVWALVN